MTQADLAEACGMSSRTEIGGIEIGAHSPTLDKLIRIVRALDVPGPCHRR